MKPQQLKQICQQALELTMEVSSFIYQEKDKVSNRDIEEKAMNSLVTYVDKTAEKKLVEGLSKLLPEATFLTEEETVEQSESSLQWIIDPLDGTTNFLKKIPFFSISIALVVDGKSCIGIVHEVNRNESFFAWEGGGAYLNGEKINISNTQNLCDAMVATGFHYHDFTRLDRHLGLVEYFIRNCRGVRRLGSAALDLAYTACGRMDVFYEYSLNPWDVAAGAFIVKEAGGVVYDFSGGDDYVHGGEILACNRYLQKEVLDKIKAAFYPVSDV